MSRFRYYLRVRYAECDAQKVVFNARYGDYIDLAVTEFVRNRCGKAAVDGSFDYQLVRQEIEWKAPARFDDVLEITVIVDRLGTTSFSLRTEFRRAGDEALIAWAQTIYVRIDPRTLEKLPLESLKGHLEKGADDVQIDHAGYLTQHLR